MTRRKMTVVWICILLTAFFMPRAVYAAELFEIILEPAQLDQATKSQKTFIEKHKKERTTKSVRVIKINTELLALPFIDMTLRSDLKVKVKADKIEKRGDRNFTWYGNMTDIPGKAILVINGENVTGTIQSGNELFRIRPLGAGAHALIEVDITKFPKDHPPSFDELEKRQESMAPTDITSSGQAVSYDLTKIINVMVAYTDNADSASPDIAGLIQLAIDETNEGYQNSGITARLQLAHTTEVTYDETTRTYDTVLNHLVGTTDGQMDGLHTLRNTHAADVVVLLIDKSDYCGLAAAIKANASSAFALVHYDCATGYYSFGHEIGHLQGARHNCGADSTTTPYSYGHGYQYQNSWRTIMSYNCPNGCPRILYWSNPNQLYNNVKLGNVCTSGSGCSPGVTCCADNTRVLNATASYVAGFRPITPPPPPPPSNPCPTGQKCCEPNPSGGCWLCVPSGAYCP